MLALRPHDQYPCDIIQICTIALHDLKQQRCTYTKCAHASCGHRITQLISMLHAG